MKISPTTKVLSIALSILTTLTGWTGIAIYRQARRTAPIASAISTPSPPSPSPRASERNSERARAQALAVTRTSR